MHTQLSHADLVLKALTKIGKEFDIEIRKFSLAAMEQKKYATGRWLYDIDSSMTVGVYRWPRHSEAYTVQTFELDENPDEFAKRLEKQLRAAILQLMRDDEMSKERYLLERIANGEMSFGPSDKTNAGLEAFQTEAEDITRALDWLVAEDYLGGYRLHPITYAGDGTWIDLILITGGLTFKGEDKSQWPD